MENISWPPQFHGTSWLYFPCHSCLPLAAVCPPRFLRCSPFDEFKVWKNQVDNNTRKGGERLTLLTRSLLLRRTKDQLDSSGKPLVIDGPLSVSWICVVFTDGQLGLFLTCSQMCHFPSICRFHLPANEVFWLLMLKRGQSTPETGRRALIYSVVSWAHHHHQHSGNIGLESSFPFLALDLLSSAAARWQALHSVLMPSVNWVRGWQATENGLVSYWFSTHPLLFCTLLNFFIFLFGLTEAVFWLPEKLILWLV